MFVFFCKHESARLETLVASLSRSGFMMPSDVLLVLSFLADYGSADYNLTTVPLRPSRTLLEPGLIINFDKTKELVLHRPHVTRHNLPQSLAGIEQVLTVRLLVVIFQSSLSFAAHVDYVLKVCSQRIFLLKQLGNA